MTLRAAARDVLDRFPPDPAPATPRAEAIEALRAAYDHPTSYGPPTITIVALSELRDIVSALPIHDLTAAGFRSAVLAAIGEALTEAER